MRFRSLNEAIESVSNPQPELTQNEYIELLESALISIAEELECDVEDLLEEHERSKGRPKISKKSSGIDPKKRAKYQNDADRIYRERLARFLARNRVDS